MNKCLQVVRYSTVAKVTAIASLLLHRASDFCKRKTCARSTKPYIFLKATKPGFLGVFVVNRSGGVFEVKSTNGDTLLGGEDFDELLLKVGVDGIFFFGLFFRAMKYLVKLLCDFMRCRTSELILIVTPWDRVYYGIL